MRPAVFDLISSDCLVVLCWVLLKVWPHGARSLSHLLSVAVRHLTTTLWPPCLEVPPPTNCTSPNPDQTRHKRKDLRPWLLPYFEVICQNIHMGWEVLRDTGDTTHSGGTTRVLLQAVALERSCPFKNLSSWFSHWSARWHHVLAKSCHQSPACCGLGVGDVHTS